MTNDEKLLEFAGVALEWCDGKPSPPFVGECRHDQMEPHTVDTPTLTGDFADVVEAKIRRRLNEDGCSVEFVYDGVVEIWRENKAWIDDTLFAATLAYLKEQEGK